MPLSQGEKLGPYEITEAIGSGGMGEVYKAFDTRLGRIVAIKKLRGQTPHLFEREARTIAALSHPNVCLLYDVGPDYLVMEYVDGKPLSGPVSVEAAVSLAVQIADGLEEAHAAGIVHRDLKPANILVTSKGTAKLLDFGLAKLTVLRNCADTQTLEGMLSGTAAYMSPEQAQGSNALDQRSDIFSFGTVLYELLSGERPFERDSLLGTLNAIVREQPPQLDSPLAVVVNKCLAKNPEQRFQTVAELKTALQRVAVAKPKENRASIAVLPFVNMSASKDDEYFSDGLAEEVLNLLVKIPELKVAARTSSFAFRGKEQDITEIANRLHVSTVLEGSVRRVGDRIRVTAQLINGADGYHIWSERYDGYMTDVFHVQDEIAAAITKALRMNLASNETTPPHRPTLPAYELFLKGRHMIAKMSREGLACGQEYLQQAIAFDPQYAEPYAELAHYFIVLGAYGIRPVREVMPLAKSFASKASDLDPSASRAHAELAVVAAVLDFDWNSAEKHFQNAKKAGTLSSEWRNRCAHWTLLPQGRFAEAIREFEVSFEQDPLSALFRSVFALVLMYAGQYDRAVTEAKKAIELDPTTWIAYFVAASSFAARQMFAQARKHAEKLVQLVPWNERCRGVLAAILSRLGEQERATELVEGCERSRLWQYYLLTGNFKTAVECYQAAIEQREPSALVAAWSDMLKPLRELPEWTAVARAMNMPDGSIKRRASNSSSS